MFVVILILTILVSCYLAWAYSIPRSNTKKVLNIKYKINISWVIIFILVMLISNYISVARIPFSVLNDANFFDTINSDYIFNYFLITLLYAIAFIVYFFGIRKYIKPHLVILIIGIFSLIIYYPGIPYADTNNLYDYYLNNQYNDWQPPLYTIWWHIFNFYGAAFLVNNISYYLGLTIISHYLYQNNKTWQNTLLIMFSINPLFFSQLNIVLKDTLFAGLTIDAIAIYLYLRYVKSIVLKSSIICIFAIILFLIIGIRYNGITATLPLAFFLIYQLISSCNYKKHNKIIIASISSIIINYIFVQANMFIAYKIFKAEKSYSLSQVFQNDMANIECRTNHSFMIPKELFVNPENTDSLRETMCNPNQTNEYNYDTLFGENWNGSGNMAILLSNHGEEVYQLSKEYWIKAVTQFPFTYLYYRTRFFLNDLLYQYYMPASALYHQNEWPTGLATLDTYNPTKLSIQQSIANFSMEQRLYLKFALSLFVICGTIATLVYFFINYSLSPALVVCIINLFTLIGWLFTSGEHPARFFLFDYIATLLAIILI